MTKRSLSIEVLVFALFACLVATLRAATPFEGPSVSSPQSRIDELVFARLNALGIKPTKLCSDAVFLRRVSLDVIGTLATAKEARLFLASTDPNKRSLLIEQLLGRDEFADYWAMKWCDVLRVKSEFPINLWPNAVQSYHRWIHTSIKDNMSYDRFAQTLLKSSGSNFRVPEVNFYRAMQGNDPETVAKAVALTFMGVRADKWPGERLSSMSAFFSQLGFKSTAEWKEQIVYFDLSKSRPHTDWILPDGTKAKVTPDEDPRLIFADWLTAPENPWFARCAVNRIWAWLLGRGIVNEADDIRPDNPPSNPELLAYLSNELVSHHFDLKHIYRLILNSQVYQLAPVSEDTTAASEANFARYPLRRLEAEVLIDALCQITGTKEKYVSPIPEPFTFIPDDQRSITLADGSITSPFLELFGRPSRDTGLESERNNRDSATQRLHMLNSSHIQRKIAQSSLLRSLGQFKSTPREAINEIYLTILSRYPTDIEMKTVSTYSKTGAVKGREVMIDLIWALLNSSEFLYRH